MVSELERDLGTATMDLAMTSRQFSQITNQLQVATEEAAQLHDNNAKLSQDLDGKSHGPFLSLFGSPLALHLSHPIFRRKPSAYLYACQDQVSCI
jgi:hypothetical protein